ncbi:MAG: succinate dehydrogenase/fumarate reductase iron-sulfur subunit [Spirulina sp. SIO3F2]|nr:succinate dehydrogenase/fumarate reductase iron-sulfur subunit [Spirulina sp. SIO3F2]
MQVTFSITRYSTQQHTYIQQYKLQMQPGQTVLDGLLAIKAEQDGTLAFRKNCRNTICGSCAMSINGRSTLACKENIHHEVSRFGRNEITIAPLGNLPVVRDLIVDMQPFWDDLEAVDPYVSTQGRTVPEREFLQTPEQRSQLEQMGNCILCGACYSECNAKAVNPDFVGPHALAKAQRLVGDNRDSQTADRLKQYGEDLSGVWGCTRCYQCNNVCPMGVEPMEQISKLKQSILDKAKPQDSHQASRPVRHRKALVELVKSGGWIDERQFGVQVVGNYFRDLKGLLSLAPLGLRMLARGKFPLSFEPSEGTEEVRNLITAVQEKKATSTSA